ncbi:enoyl-CoA hydratase-related protein [Variovorax terrae]|uniref:Enoyl-CoA hydratase-related protein n=1 Tax=Variovorax terrae TaxID=2923278 RepID=A0A9X1VWU4_9BURK|nr:enoyl-CoA hydratase-related protein [Variovorax terrae]MCJ0763367.1 enoyl-CoA hydratase-related protein [Variovorax terrae]
MNHSSYETLAFSQDGAVLTVKLNRPQTLNAVSSQLHTELSRVFADIAADSTVDAVVLTGEGRAFSAGGDLEWFRTITGPQLDTLFVEARKIIVDLVDLPQPIIAAVNGAAAGLGATLALFCDVVYVAEGAKIADPHVRVGITAGDGGAAIWPLLVGPARAKEYLMTGDSLTATEAERIGLVNKVLPASEVLPAAQALAKRLAQGSRPAVRSTKLSVNKLVRDAVSLVLDTSLALEKECFGTPFHKQAIEAFSKKP